MSCWILYFRIYFVNTKIQDVLEASEIEGDGQYINALIEPEF